MVSPPYIPTRLLALFLPIALLIKETKINFPVWMSATKADMMRFGLGSALPGTVVVGKNGRIAKVMSGVVNQTDLKKQLDAMLAPAEATRVDETKKEVASAIVLRNSEQKPETSHWIAGCTVRRCRLRNLRGSSASYCRVEHQH